MKNFKLLFTAIATFAITATLFSFNGKHATNEKKKFTNIVYFTYNGSGSLTDAGNWTAATSSLCPSGTINTCGISFDASQTTPVSFALSGGLPNSTVLSDAATDFAASGTLGQHQFTAADNITCYRQN
jgi:hypothetical protein